MTRARIVKKYKVQESIGAFDYNVVLAGKSDGRRRMCINSKPLNKITVKQKFPMLRIDDVLDILHGSPVYSTFDFADAFSKTPTYPDDSHTTAFSTRTRKLSCACMPFRLVNALLSCCGWLIKTF